MMALAGVMAFATQANAITFTFQENGPGDLGSNHSVFVESGFSLTVDAFLNNGDPTNLFAKNLGGDETGLGTTSDPTHQNEIWTGDFIQLTLPTSPASNFQLVLVGSVQAGEEADIYFSNTLGVLGAQIGTLTSDGSFSIPAADQTGFIGITAGKANVLLNSATITTVPDGGSAVALLGIALAAIEGLRRTLRTR